MNIDEKLRHYVKSITEVMDVDLIILFGSYARGNPHEYSDIDLAVISKELDPQKPRWENIKLIEEKAHLRLDPDLQIIPFAKESFDNDADSPIGSFIREIKETGKVIYSNGNK
ncbi:MAG: nucleotidyltransferase domain-containing protein [Candidatus Melainabacteria bacterium]|nr:nucleotidyltransferase domain-containing protein [Candidatus Melainabacteria bacterium]